MPAKRILFGFLLCLALWLVVLAAQALTLGTEKSLISLSHRASGVRRFQNGPLRPHLDKAQRVIPDVMDHLTGFFSGCPQCPTSGRMDLRNYPP